MSAPASRQSGPGLYEGLYSERDDLAEVYRRLAYDLFRFWESNDKKIRWLSRSFTLAASAVAIEIVLLVTLVSGRLF